MTLNRLTERMTRVNLKGFVVRAWTTAEEGDYGQDHRVTGVLHDLGNRPTDWPPAHSEIVEAIDSLGHEVVAAYEILDADGNGCVIYPDWK
tara:strand:- start:39047 stop:39319 length:273 start_codon:yes stop_codon:yes gene_type:complete